MEKKLAQPYIKTQKKSLQCGKKKLSRRRCHLRNPTHLKVIQKESIVKILLFHSTKQIQRHQEILALRNIFKLEYAQNASNCRKHNIVQKFQKDFYLQITRILHTKFSSTFQSEKLSETFKQSGRNFRKRSARTHIVSLVQMHSVDLKLNLIMLKDQSHVD